MKESPDRSVRYLNREQSWLDFNRRVLDEADNPSNPLLERLRFLAIFESNLDEFYMVRVSGLIEQYESGAASNSPDGLSPTEQLDRISEIAEPMRQRAADLYANKLRVELEAAGITIRSYGSLTPKQREKLTDYFMREVFPLCTPLILHPSPNTPFISNRSLNLAVELTDGLSEPRIGRVKVPTGIPRVIRTGRRKYEFILLEDLISNHLDTLFPGMKILGSYRFRVIRDADIEIREFEAADLIATIERTIRLRRFGDPVLLEHERKMPPRVRKIIMSLLKLDREDVFDVDGVLGMEFLWEVAAIDRPALRYPAHQPYVPASLATAKSIFSTVAERDVLLHHPFDGFQTIEEFVRSAAQDPAVVGIKQTLYRVGSHSPIVESLLDAAEHGKQVAAMVELKARFDESNNLGWARALERSGVHVTYGFPEMKTHCKLCMVVRKERTGLKTYVHIGTGNYNPSTARQYTDLGILTTDPEVTRDVSELFNYLTGFSKQTRYRKLLVAPLNLREGILSRIDREVQCFKATGVGAITWKLNSLVDPEVIDALYIASQAGVKVTLIVRGVCCLRPGVPGLSERISVRSIVGRFLEHSRIYRFENGGAPEMLIGSADAMRRNLDRRIEVLVPIDAPELRKLIDERIIAVYLKDNQRAWNLQADGTYARIIPAKNEKPFDAQEYLQRHPTGLDQFGKSAN